jgi:hypothetical protein
MAILNKPSEQPLAELRGPLQHPALPRQNPLAQRTFQPRREKINPSRRLHK